VYVLTLYCFLSFASSNDDTISIIDNYYLYIQHVWLFHVITFIILSLCASSKSYNRYIYDKSNENNNIVGNYHSSLENSYTAAVSASVSKTNIYSINNSSIQALVKEFRNDVLDCNNDYNMELTSNICATRIDLSIGEVRLTNFDRNSIYDDDDYSSTNDIFNENKVGSHWKLYHSIQSLIIYLKLGYYSML